MAGRPKRRARLKREAQKTLSRRGKRLSPRAAAAIARARARHPDVSRMTDAEMEDFFGWH